MPAGTVTFTTRSFLALVTEADPDFYFEGRHPVVYHFQTDREFRDSGPNSGVYSED